MSLYAYMQHFDSRSRGSETSDLHERYQGESMWTYGSRNKWRRTSGEMDEEQVANTKLTKRNLWRMLFLHASFRHLFFDELTRSPLVPCI